MEFSADEAYEDAGLTISRKAAIRIVEKHGSTVEELDKELGIQDRYSAWDILAWLGY